MPQKRNELKMRQLNRYRNVTLKMRTYLKVSSAYLSSEKSEARKAKVENDGQVHDFIDQKIFLIEG